MTTKSMESDQERCEFTVTQLTSMIKNVLADTFPSVWVLGEITDLSRPRSGHIYFSLKDEQAKLQAVIWRNVASHLPFEPEDGQQVICRGSIDLYPPHGKYQLNVRQIEPRGEGALQRAFRKLHTKLEAEGLFRQEHKQPLPRFPRRIALVTSLSGAAIQDFLQVLRRRWQGVHVWLIGSRVQGEGAADEIVAGIRLANQVAPSPDVLVVGRGGGSPEDLWCFNEERVVRAIFASQVPVVSAVGHEIDITLSDLVADVRALTPTEAAERVVPSSEEMVGQLNGYGQRLSKMLGGIARQARSHVDAVAGHPVFRRPYQRVHDLARRLDELENRSTRALRGEWVRSGDRIGGLAGRLESLSPVSVLGRGYSVTTRASDQQLISDASTLSPGQQITTRLARGRVTSRVESIEQNVSHTNHTASDKE